jgi:hypothetical protein
MVLIDQRPALAILLLLLPGGNALSQHIRGQPEFLDTLSVIDLGRIDVALGVNRHGVDACHAGPPRRAHPCQSALKFDPVSALNFDPFERRVLTVALGSSELAGIAETGRARVA